MIKSIRLVNTFEDVYKQKEKISIIHSETGSGKSTEILNVIYRSLNGDYDYKKVVIVLHVNSKINDLFVEIINLVYIKDFNKDNCFCNKIKHFYCKYNCSDFSFVFGNDAKYKLKQLVLNNLCKKNCIKKKDLEEIYSYFNRVYYYSNCIITNFYFIQFNNLSFFHFKFLERAKVFIDECDMFVEKIKSIFIGYFHVHNIPSIFMFSNKINIEIQSNVLTYSQTSYLKEQFMLTKHYQNINDEYQDLKTKINNGNFYMNESDLYTYTNTGFLKKEEFFYNYQKKRFFKTLTKNSNDIIAKLIITHFLNISRDINSISEINILFYGILSKTAYYFSDILFSSNISNLSIDNIGHNQNFVESGLVINTYPNNLGAYNSVKILNGLFNFIKNNYTYNHYRGVNFYYRDHQENEDIKSLILDEESYYEKENNANIHGLLKIYKSFLLNNKEYFIESRQVYSLQKSIVDYLFLKCVHWFVFEFCSFPLNLKFVEVVKNNTSDDNCLYILGCLNKDKACIFIDSFINFTYKCSLVLNRYFGNVFVLQNINYYSNLNLKSYNKKISLISTFNELCFNFELAVSKLKDGKGSYVYRHFINYDLTLLFNTCQNVYLFSGTKTSLVEEIVKYSCTHCSQEVDYIVNSIKNKYTLGFSSLKTIYIVICNDYSIIVLLQIIDIFDYVCNFVYQKHDLKIMCFFSVYEEASIQQKFCLSIFNKNININDKSIISIIKSNSLDSDFLINSCLLFSSLLGGMSRGFNAKSSRFLIIDCSYKKPTNSVSPIGLQNNKFVINNDFFIRNYSEQKDNILLQCYGRILRVYDTSKFYYKSIILTNVNYSIYNSIYEFCNTMKDLFKIKIINVLYFNIEYLSQFLLNLYCHCYLNYELYIDKKIVITLLGLKNLLLNKDSMKLLQFDSYVSYNNETFIQYKYNKKDDFSYYRIKDALFKSDNLNLANKNKIWLSSNINKNIKINFLAYKPIFYNDSNLKFLYLLN
ncbi:hypothetical protein AB837_00216 [bacterium AB1]|nr:hypothetical protein AB837_00216 [bacterium AB1]